MTPPPPEPAPAGPPKAEVDALIEALLAQPPERRAAIVAGAGPSPPAAWLIAIADRAAELAIADIPRAERAARVAAEIADAGGLASAAARARVALGHVLNYATRFDESLGALDDASRLARAAGDAFAVARAALVSMHALARLGRMDEAVDAGNRAIDGFNRIGEPAWRAKVDVNLGVLKRMRDDPEGALHHFDAARAVFASAPAILAQIESNRAEALLDMARFSQAEQAFASALESFRTAGASHAAAIAEGNLADLLSRQGRFERALGHFESARRAMESAGAGAPPGDLARLRSEEGDALAVIGMDEDAAASYRLAIESLDRAGLAAEAARARIGLAGPLERLGRHAEADAALRDAIEALAGLASATWLARAEIRRAALLRDAARPEEALALLNSTIPLLTDRPIDRAAALVLRASVHAALNRHADALLDAAEGLAPARALAMFPVACEALHQRSVALAHLGRHAEAVDASLQAIEIAERIRGSLQADRFRAASMQARHAVYEQALAVLMQRAAAGATAAADLDLVFETADRARARALLDLVHGGVELTEQLIAGESAGDAALVRELSHTRAAMNALYDRAFNAKEGATRAASATTLESLEATASELERRLAAVRRFAAFSPPAVRAHQVRHVLAPDEALVEFVGIHGAMHAIVVRNDRPPAIERLAALDAIAEQAQRLSMTIDRAILGAIRRPGLSPAAPPAPDAACARILSRLHTLLIAPIEPHLAGATRLLLSPHDLLYAMPLHALAAEGRALIDRFEVLTTPSAALLWHARTRPHPAAAGAPLIVGVPDEVAPEMGDEARAVAAALPNSRLLLGTDATFAAFASAAGDAPLIHLACHGVFPSRNPMQARLRFSDGWVTVRDLLALSLPGSVVVLSGCETGRARVARGDEAYGLGRALLATGASAVVMSLWPVHDRTTRELMEAVYHAMGRVYLSGTGPGTASKEGTTAAPTRGQGGFEGTRDLAAHLARAQRGLIARGVHPAMWAPFVVMGEPA